MVICFKKGNLEECKLFLEKNGIESLKVSYNGETLMLITCRNGHLSVCKWLFEVGSAAAITAGVNAMIKFF